MASSQTVVIVGGGQAGAWAARTLRTEGFTGPITLVNGEEHPPCGRPPLSKQLMTGNGSIESAYVFPAKAYDDWNIQLLLGMRVTAINTQAATISLHSGERLAYDKLLLATGGTPRRIGLPGAALKNVFYLRAISDTLAIRQHLAPAGHLLVIGGGWIGLEVAAAARSLGTAVTVVESAPRQCNRAAPPAVSEFLLNLHRDSGVTIRLDEQIKSIEGTSSVERVVFADGTSVDVSAVVVGIGLQPSTELAANAHLAIDNGIVVDEFWQTSVSAIFAAGDVASFRNTSGMRVRLESWNNAQTQGIAAAKGILGKAVKTDPFPWFWSDQYDQNIQIVGDVVDSDVTVPLHSAAAGASVSLYFRQGKAAGAVGINAGRDIRLLKRHLDSGRVLDIHALTERPLQKALKS
jgi:3-phenylpropionate/trans-cinnamate dioxygenase ferredoxin reductase subunit